MTPATTFETKDATDVSTALDGLHRAFEAFKSEQNDISASADVIHTEKLSRIERTLDDLSLKVARPRFGETTAAHPHNREHKAAFESYMRRGDANALHRLEAKALSAGSNPDGGYLVPPETEAAVNRSLVAISPIRAIASVRQVSTSVFRKPFAVNGLATGWVAETATRPGTNAPTLADIDFPTMELYAMPAASQALLDDAIINVDQWIADEVRLAFALQEGAAFINGDGIAKPKGFLAYPIVADSAWSYGNLGFITTGVAGAFPATTPSDKLIELIYSVRAGYRANGTFVMNRQTQSAVRKMKDGAGRYIWEPANKPGEAPSLMGYAIAEAEDMPNIAADATPIAFGDFARGYLVVDRVGIRILRDPYSSKPYVLFYTTKRVGGGIQDFAAIKLLKFSA